ncbi:autotransporter domain-containing protein [Klebsiella sp. Ap-873]|nr:autotransporter domain-containing protein [Klebsiella sp. Ap-873]
MNKISALSLSALAAALSILSPTSIAASLPDVTQTNPTNNIGSQALGLSADGSIVVGTTNNHAFRWSDGSLTDLGTLATGNAGGSSAHDVSTDGNIVIGESSTDSGSTHAFRWEAGNMVDLGTLKTANAGTSRAIAVSGDGNVAVGESDTDSGNVHAARWVSGTKTDLGTLAVGNVGASSAYGVSNNGSVIVGHANTDSGEDHAFRWDSNGMVDLGTFAPGNAGQSIAQDVSADGNVVVGRAANANGVMRAFRWTTGGMVDIGTLSADNSGTAVAFAVSGDGNTVGGSSFGAGVGNGSVGHAYLWRADTGMFDLTPGLLQRNSTVTAINADGTVAAGVTSSADINNFSGRAALWRISWPTPPVTTPPVTTPPVTTPPVTTPPVTTPPVTTPPVTTLPIVTMVDVQNAQSSRWELGGETFNVLELTRNRLNWLNNPCDVNTQGTLCIRGGTDYQTSNHADDLAASLSVGYGFTDAISAGINLSTSIAGKLPNDYRHSGSNIGAGAWTTWRQADEKGAWFTTLAGSLIQSDTDIRMQDRDNSDPGKASPNIKGLSASLELGREMFISTSVNGKISGGVVRDQLEQAGYTEKDSAFPFEYDKIKYNVNYAFLSMEADVVITPRLTWVNQVRGEQNLDATDVKFSARSSYLGEINRKENLTGTRWNLSSGLNYEIKPTVSVSIMPWAGNSALGDMSYGGNIALTGKF